MKYIVKPCRGKMDIKIEIKEEVISQTERESFSPDVTMKLNSDATAYIKVCETEIKEENVDSEFRPPNDWQSNSKNPVTKIKQCNDDYDMQTKPKMNKPFIDSDFCSKNEEQCDCEVPAVTVNPSKKDLELDTKIEIKEELQWLETTSEDTPSFDDVTEDWVEESFPSTESIRVYREAESRDKSGLFSKEKSGKNARFNMIQDSPESAKARKFTSEDIYVQETSSVQKSVFSEQHCGGQVGSKPSCLKNNDFIQCLQMHDLNVKNNCYESDLVRDNKCGKCFTRLQHLKSHNNAIKVHKCDTLGMGHTRLRNLKSHRLIHEGEKSNKCDICGKCYTSLAYLKNHKMTHERKKIHKCDICGKCFTQLQYLNSHKLTRHYRKAHKCDTCGKCFTTLSDLKSHKLTHESIMQCKCDICGKCFNWLNALIKHKLTHEDQKSNNCDTCGKCYRTLHHLKIHKFTHDGIKPHKCDTCRRYFIYLEGLRRHKLTCGGT